MTYDFDKPGEIVRMDNMQEITFHPIWPNTLNGGTFNYVTVTNSEIYILIWSSSIWEDRGAPVSAHTTRKGALKAQLKHTYNRVQENRDEYLMYGTQYRDYYDLSDEFTKIVKLNLVS